MQQPTVFLKIAVNLKKILLKVIIILLRALIIERKIVSVAEVITMISKTEAWRKKETLTSTKK